MKQVFKYYKMKCKRTWDNPGGMNDWTAGKTYPVKQTINHRDPRFNRTGENLVDTKYMLMSDAGYPISFGPRIRAMDFEAGIRITEAEYQSLMSDLTISQDVV